MKLPFAQDQQSLLYGRLKHFYFLCVQIHHHGFLIQLKEGEGLPGASTDVYLFLNSCHQVRLCLVEASSLLLIEGEVIQSLIN